MNLNKKISLITLPVISYASILPLTSCSANGKIVFANYESYFSTDLTRKYQNEVNFLYYQTDGDIRAKFRKSYDIAVPTTAEALRYIKDGWLTQIDWSAFGTIAQETYPDGYYGNDTQPYLQYLDDDGELQNIKNGYDAEKLLAGYDNGFGAYADDDLSIDVMCDAYDIIREIDEYANDQDFFPQSYLAEAGDEYSILDFTIPYFFQDYLFIYKGMELENPHVIPDNNEWTWSDIGAKVGKGDNHDPRFNGRPNNKVLDVDDMRTNFDVGKIIEWETEGMDVDTFTVNPGQEDDSIDYFKTIYSDYFEAYKGTNQVLLNSDSGQLVASFCDPVNTSNGMYTYNGDAMLASLGNGQINNEAYWSNEWYKYAKSESTNAPMSIISPEYNLLAIDTAVINEHSVKVDENNKANLDDKKTNEIYSFLYATMLDHVDYSSQPGIASDNGEDSHNPTIAGSSDLWIDDPDQIWAWDDEEDMYIYDVMNNFDWVLYVSPWAKIDQYIWGYQYGKVEDAGNDYAYMPIDCGADYFWETVSGMFNEYVAEFDPDADDELCEQWATMLGEAYKILTGNKYYNEDASAINAIEIPLSDLQKSNMYESYIRVKNTL